MNAFHQMMQPLDYPRQAIMNLGRGVGRFAAGEGSAEEALRMAPGAAGALMTALYGLPAGVLAGGAAQGLGRIASEDTFDAPTASALLEALGGDPTSGLQTMGMHLATDPLMYLGVGSGAKGISKLMQRQPTASPVPRPPFNEPPIPTPPMMSPEEFNLRASPAPRQTWPHDLNPQPMLSRDPGLSVVEEQLALPTPETQLYGDLGRYRTETGFGQQNYYPATQANIEADALASLRAEKRAALEAMPMLPPINRNAPRMSEMESLFGRHVGKRPYEQNLDRMYGVYQDMLSDAAGAGGSVSMEDFLARLELGRRLQQAETNYMRRAGLMHKEEPPFLRPGLTREQAGILAEQPGLVSSIEYPQYLRSPEQIPLEFRDKLIGRGSVTEDVLIPRLAATNPDLAASHYQMQDLIGSLGGGVNHYPLTSGVIGPHSFRFKNKISEALNAADQLMASGVPLDKAALTGAYRDRTADLLRRVGDTISGGGVASDVGAFSDLVASNHGLAIPEPAIQVATSGPWNSLGLNRQVGSVMRATRNNPQQREAFMNMLIEALMSN